MFEIDVRIEWREVEQIEVEPIPIRGMECGTKSCAAMENDLHIREFSDSPECFKGDKILKPQCRKLGHPSFSSA